MWSDGRVALTCFLRRAFPAKTFPKKREPTRNNREMCLFNVDGGQRAVIFDRFQGVKEAVVGEGTHFMIPVVQKPIIIDVRARPRTINSITGTKDLQMANISLRFVIGAYMGCPGGWVSATSRRCSLK